LQDTTQWITSKLLLAGWTNETSAGTQSEAVKSATITDCVLSYSTHDEFHTLNSAAYPENILQREELHTVPLGAITTVVTGDNHKGLNSWIKGVTVNLSSQVYVDKRLSETDRIIGSPEHSFVPEQPDNASSLEVLFALPGQDNQDLMQRMQKALTRAAELCAPSYRESKQKEAF
jgi:hypothetical protein